MEFSELFVQVMRLAGGRGMVRLGTIAVDSTKIKGKASRHRAMSHGRMQSTEIELKAQIAVDEHCPWIQHEGYGRPD